MIDRFAQNKGENIEMTLNDLENQKNINISRAARRRGMKTSAALLVILGILLEIAAFLGDKAESVPVVLSLVAPKYIEAQSGLVKLEKKMTLSPGDPGFEAIANIFLLRLAEENPPDRLAGVSVMKIERQTPKIVFGNLRAGEVVPVTFSLSNGQSLDWSLDGLIETILALKKGRVFQFSAIVFVVGILIQIVGFIMQVREAR